MTVIAIFFLGVVVGTIFKKQYKIFKYSEVLTTISLYLLLLFLGISIGNNSDIVSNIGQIGVKGVLFAFAASLGSIIFIIPLYLIFGRGKE